MVPHVDAVHDLVHEGQLAVLTHVSAGEQGGPPVAVGARLQGVRRRGLVGLIGRIGLPLDLFLQLLVAVLIEI